MTPSRKNLPILITLTALLVVLVLGILAVQGLKSVLLEVTANSTNDKIYLATQCQNNSSVCREEIEKARAQYRGQKLGAVKLYQGTELGGSYFEIDSEAVLNLLIINLDTLPEGKIPVLIPNGTDIEKLDTHFIPAGSYANFNFNKAFSHHSGIFAPIISEITTPAQPIYMINDGTNVIEKFLLEKLLKHNNNIGGGDVKINDFLEFEQQVIIFSNYKEAIDYQKSVGDIKLALTTDIFGDTLEINRVFNNILVIFYWVTGFVTLLTIAALLDVVALRAKYLANVKK